MPFHNRWRPLVALAVLASTAMPALAEAAPSCDRRGGRTLAANERVRLYRVDRTRPVRIAFDVCTYRTRKVRRVASWDAELASPERRPVWTWALNGSVVALAQRHRGSTAETDRSGALAWESLSIWNAATRRMVRPPTRPDGLAFSSMVVSSSGTVAAIADPSLFGTLPDGTQGPRDHSYVLLFEPGAAPQAPSVSNVWRIVAQSGVGALSGLALSGSRLVWQESGVLRDAPLAASGLANFAD